MLDQDTDISVSNLIHLSFVIAKVMCTLSIFLGLIEWFGVGERSIELSKINWGNSAGNSD